MLREIEEMYGFAIRATDGDIGKVQDFYFDDESWTVRYVVVDTGPWVLGRRVLISPQALEPSLWVQEVIPSELTTEQVKKSPDVDLDQPVSRQMELLLHDHYQWEPYWRPSGPAHGLGAAAAADILADAVAEGASAVGEQRFDPNLRSTREIAGYSVQAQDGDVGRVEGFLASDIHWAIRYLIVNTGVWLAGRQVLVSPEWAENVDWAASKLRMSVEQDAIRESPQYETGTPISREFELELFRHYRFPPYWL
jgi:hypothetical protein